jgi:membrane-associated phospholipid phosphatase
MVAIAMLTARWCKLSLHMAFVVFAVFLLLLDAPWWAGLAGLCFAGAVAWSRLALRRHVPRDLIAGAAVGALAGIAFALAVAAGAV